MYIVVVFMFVMAVFVAIIAFNSIKIPKDDEDNDNDDINPIDVYSLMYRYPAEVQAGGLDNISEYVTMICSDNYQSTVFPNPFNCEQIMLCTTNSNFTVRNCGTSSRGVVWPSGNCVDRHLSHCHIYPIPPLQN
nr:ORF70 [Darna trima granulovirus]